MTETKYYKLTKVKRHNGDQENTYVPVGTSMTGYLSEEQMPQVSFPFYFHSDFGLTNNIQTSIVKEVDKEVEPGITFIKTLNSIYKLEELEEE